MSERIGCKPIDYRLNRPWEKELDQTPLPEKWDSFLKERTGQEVENSMDALVSVSWKNPDGSTTLMQVTAREMLENLNYEGPKQS